MVTPVPTPGTLVPCDNPRSYKWKRKLCDCVACRDLSAAEYQRWHTRSILGKTDPRVPAEATIDAIRRLTSKKRQYSFSVASIAHHAGVREETIWSLMRGEHKTTRKSIADAIEELAKLNPQRDEMPVYTRRKDMVRVDRKAQRAIQGLMFQGYPCTWIAERTGRHPTSQISVWLRGKTKYISVENEKMLLDVVAEVGLTPGPSERVRQIARRRGYKSLAQWDDFL